MTTDTMKIFLDTADVPTIKKAFSTGLLDGITTNPTLIMKSGRQPTTVYDELADMGIRDISMEVVESTAAGMVREANKLIEQFGDVATIKVPCTKEGLLACRELANNNVRVNVTLIFSPSQAILAAKAGATYVSPFVGRVDDNSFGGLCLIKDIVNIYQQQSWFQTEVLAASIRNVRDVGRAFEYGANICTSPPNVFEGMYNHILTDKGLELFDEAWKCVEATTVT